MSLLYASSIDLSVRLQIPKFGERSAKQTTILGRPQRQWFVRKINWCVLVFMLKLLCVTCVIHKLNLWSESEMVGIEVDFCPIDTTL